MSRTKSTDGYRFPDQPMIFLDFIFFIVVSLHLAHFVKLICLYKQLDDFFCPWGNHGLPFKHHRFAARVFRVQHQNCGVLPVSVFIIAEHFYFLLPCV